MKICMMHNCSKQVKQNIFMFWFWQNYWPIWLSVCLGRSVRVWPPLGWPWVPKPGDESALRWSTCWGNWKGRTFVLTHWPLGDLNEILDECSCFSVNDGWRISNKIALRWISLDLTDDTSTFVQVMAWCRQATSHYLSQCGTKSMLPYGITRP